MKPIIPILVFLSAAWIFGGSYYLANTYCGIPAESISPLEISDSELNFTTSSNQHFSFLPSSGEVRVEENAGKSFSEVAQHLQQNKERFLTLTGGYLANESNRSEYANLGIARAEAIKEFLVNMDTVLADRIKTAGVLKDAISSLDERQINGVQFDFSTAPPSTSDIIGDLMEEEEDIMEAAPTFTLYGKKAIKGLKMDVNLQQQIDNMRSTLDLNPEARILVTGHSAASRLDSKSKDLALIWASNVRRFFRNNGIRSKEIKAVSKGAEDPLVAPDNVEAITKNNRVTVEIVLPEQ